MVNPRIRGLRIKERATCQSNRFENSRSANPPVPRFHQLVNGLAAGQRLQNLPNHDACSIVGRLSVANPIICDDVFTKLEPLFINMAHNR
jgi:hypothetical protein